MSTPTETAQHIIALERAWANAMQARDLAQLDALVTPDFFVTIAAQGMPLQVTHRERWLSVMPTYEIQEMTIDDIRAQVYDDVAVVTLLWTQRARVNGNERSGTFFITDIWRKTEHGWRVSERHSSRPEPATAARPQ
jgi:ketosteroid isomerase-like protein